MAVRTPLGSRISPINTSISFLISGGSVSSQPPFSKGIIITKGLYLFALANQFFRQMAADETVGARHHYGMCHTTSPYRAWCNMQYSVISIL